MPLKIGSKEFTTGQAIFLSACAVLVLAVILIFAGVLPGGRQSVEEINITVWVLDEDTRVWRSTIGRFGKSYPDINVTYEEINPANYERDLLNALAAGRGPDIFMFNSKWLIEHGDKVAPAPSSKITTETFSGLFPQVAEQDFVSSGRVYAMPLHIDTLALLYNRDIFDLKGVVFPPKTWVELEGAVAKIRVFENGAIKEKAAAIGGTSVSITNAVDLVGLMMMQNGASIINNTMTRATLGREGEAGLSQYVKFGSPQNPLYTWRDAFGPANDAFAEEEVAITFAYPSDAREIREANPFLDFEVSSIPQVNKLSPTNFANYWGLAVSSSATNTEAAWDFAIFAATDKTSVEDYLAQAGHSPALRFLINDYLGNPDIGVFAEQALTAKSWPQVNDDEVDTIFNVMINSVITGEVTVDKAASNARADLTELIRR